MTAHLGNPPAGGLTLDALAAAVRDDTRYTLLRDDATLILEAAGRFTRLTVSEGRFALLQGQALSLRTLTVEVREGGL